MCALKVELMEDEEVLFETDRAILTNQRLLANLDPKNPETVTDVAALRDIASFKKSNGGQESRMRPGLMAAAIGLLLLLITFSPLRNVSGTFEILVFSAGFLLFLIGIYLALSSLVRIRPHTSVLFSILGSRDIPVYLPGRDNPAADELTRHFVRAKRRV